jgi:hypothetical protein
MSLLKTVSERSGLIPYATNTLHQYGLERRQYALDLIEFDRQFASQFSNKPQTEGYEDGISHEEFKK